MKKIRNKKTKYAANYTIECALIMPLILYSVVLIVWLMIYLYDAMVVQIAMIHGLMAVEYNQDLSNTQLCKEIKGRTQEELSGRLLGVSEVSVRVEVKKSKCIVKTNVKMNTLTGIPGISKLSEYSSTETKKRINTREVIRKTRRAEGIYKYLVRNKIISDGEDIDESEDL